MQDPKKRKWVDSLAADVVYVSGRKRPPGEMNGKSGNINNVCSQLYPPGTVVPGNELICIFDADQVCTTFDVTGSTHVILQHVCGLYKQPVQPPSPYLSCLCLVGGLQPLNVY